MCIFRKMVHFFLDFKHTWFRIIIKRIAACHNEVDDPCQEEEKAAPEGHVFADGGEDGLLLELALPLHLIVHVGELVEEISHLQQELKHSKTENYKVCSTFPINCCPLTVSHQYIYIYEQNPIKSIATSSTAKVHKSMIRTEIFRKKKEEEKKKKTQERLG